MLYICALLNVYVIGIFHEFYMQNGCEINKIYNLLQNGFIVY